MSNQPTIKRPQAVSVLLSSLTLDTGLWCRAGYHERSIEKYRWKYAMGVNFPPLVAFRVDGVLLLVDGWHRYQAAKLAGFLALPVFIHDGTRRDAVLFSIQANAEHDSAEIRKEKKAQATRLLQNPLASGFSLREIADMVGLSSSTIGKLRRQLGQPGDTTKEVEERFSLVYCDLPWRYEPGYEDPNETRSTLSQEELCALDVSALCAPDAILCMHVSPPKMAEAFDIVKAWGFTFQEYVLWINEKDAPGIDPWAQCVHEFIFFSFRGNAPKISLDSFATQKPSEITPCVARAVTRQFLESTFPELRRAELSPKEKHLHWTEISLQNLNPNNRSAQ